MRHAHCSRNDADESERLRQQQATRPDVAAIDLHPKPFLLSLFYFSFRRLPWPVKNTILEENSVIGFQAQTAL
jgi:hypothetical protein